MIEWGPVIIESLLLIPYFGWGVYTLYLRYHRREETTLVLESVTLLCLIPFFAFQADYLRLWAGNYPAEYLWALLGLFGSGLALYGHLMVSLASHLIVDTLHPGRECESNEPRFGAAEASERQDDYAGALREYELLARAYPKHVLVNLRLAETLIELDRPAEAVLRFTIVFDNAPSPEKALPVVSRLYEVHAHMLDDPGAANAALESFLERFPDSALADSVRDRLERPASNAETPLEIGLETLDENPIIDEEPAEAPEAVLETSLEALGAHPVAEEEEGDDDGTEVELDAPEETAGGTELGSGLIAAMDAVPLDELEVDADQEDAVPSKETSQESLLEPMDAAPRNEDGEKP